MLESHIEYELELDKAFQRTFESFKAYVKGLRLRCRSFLGFMDVICRVHTWVPCFQLLL